MLSRCFEEDPLEGNGEGEGEGKGEGEGEERRVERAPLMERREMR